MALRVKITSVGCRVCGRQLKNPASIAKGVGPQCGAEFKKSYRKRKEKNTIDMFDAEFEYKIRKWKANGGPQICLVIHDLSRGGKSVTNDMENVLKKIIRETGKPDHDTPIVYSDSDGIYDGVKYDPVKDHVQFLPLRLEIENEAIQKVQEYFQ